MLQEKRLTFLHLNARALLPKISELKLIATRSKAAAISITESWLDSSVTNTEIDIEGHNVIRKDRNRNGGRLRMLCLVFRIEQKLRN